MSRKQMERLSQSRRPRSGDPCDCPQCRGVLKVVDSKVKIDLQVRVRYLGCGVCGVRPDDNKVIVPLEYAPMRHRG